MMALCGSMELTFIRLKTSKKQNNKLKNMVRNNLVFEAFCSLIRRI